MLALAEARLRELTEASRTSLDIRHVVVARADEHASAANGLHNVARHLAREQLASGHRARVIILRDSADAMVPVTDHLTTIVRSAGLRLLGRFVWLRRDVIQHLLQDAGSRTIFHFHAAREPVLLHITRRLKRGGIPYVFTIHGRYSHVYPKGASVARRATAFYLRWVESRALVNAAFIQALSTDEARVLRCAAPGATVEVVGNGAYSSAVVGRPLAGEQDSKSALFPHFMFSGRYAIHHKGLDLLFKGFARYRRQGGSGYLTTFGSGAASGELQKLANDLGISAFVEILGPLFGDHRDTMLSRADFFIMPSRYEGLPLAGLEAALLSLPLIVSGETGLLETVLQYEAGLPILALRPEAVADAMHRAQKMSEAQWRFQSRAAYRMAMETADWSVISGRLVALYSQALSRA